MEKSAGKDLALPSPSDIYKFKGSPLIAIRTRTDDQPRYVDTTLSTWIWYDGGVAMKIDWSALKLSPELMEIAKGFIAYALEKYAPITASMFAEFIRNLSNSRLSQKYPWCHDDLVAALFELNKSRHTIVSFRTFYRWCIYRGIKGFYRETYPEIKDIKSPRYDPYARIYLSQSSLEFDEEIKLLKRIDRDVTAEGWMSLQSNILLHLGFELGPRAIQFHSLDIKDFEVIEVPNHYRYYTLWLPMAKKVGQRRAERRPRKITTQLGEKINKHVLALQFNFGNACEALFASLTGNRLSVVDIRQILKDELCAADIERPNQVTMLLRHHLGQGLADQGTPADIIAEILGHNSTVPARAYIAATPNIARIKEKALGKSSMYKRIMRSLLTGEIVKRRDTISEREVRGVVNMQYIGGIGACALPTHTHCPYNPVYACYTCKKFHPFADGRHEQVKEALQQEAQRFIDAAEKFGELSQNRPLAQHQATILAVTATIERCRQSTMEADSD